MPTCVIEVVNAYDNWLASEIVRIHFAFERPAMLNLEYVAKSDQFPLTRHAQAPLAHLHCS